MSNRSIDRLRDNVRTVFLGHLRASAIVAMRGRPAEELASDPAPGAAAAVEPLPTTPTPEPVPAELEAAIKDSRSSEDLDVRRTAFSKVQQLIMEQAFVIPARPTLDDRLNFHVLTRQSFER